MKTSHQCEVFLKCTKKKTARDNLLPSVTIFAELVHHSFPNQPYRRIDVTRSYVPFKKMYTDITAFLDEIVCDRKHNGYNFQKFTRNDKDHN